MYGLEGEGCQLESCLIGLCLVNGAPHWETSLLCAIATQSIFYLYYAKVNSLFILGQTYFYYLAQQCCSQFFGGSLLKFPNNHLPIICSSSQDPSFRNPVSPYEAAFTSSYYILYVSHAEVSLEKFYLSPKGKISPWGPIGG